MNIEVEIRSFISQEKYEELIQFFTKEGVLRYHDFQENHYLDTKEDIRIQRNSKYTKVWLKKGKMHDEQREEIEVKCKKEDFDTVREIFFCIGCTVEIQWFRKRHAFDWDGIQVMVDYTKGYGYIIELEKMATEEEKEATLTLLKEKLAGLDIPLTPKEEFDKKYAHYKEHWETLIAD